MGADVDHKLVRVLSSWMSVCRRWSDDCTSGRKLVRSISVLLTPSIGENNRALSEEDSDRLSQLCEQLRSLSERLAALVADDMQLVSEQLHALSRLQQFTNSTEIHLPEDQLANSLGCCYSCVELSEYVAGMVAGYVREVEVKRCVAAALAHSESMAQLEVYEAAWTHHAYLDGQHQGTQDWIADVVGSRACRS